MVAKKALATIISSFCLLSLAGCTVGLPDGSMVEVSYIPPPPVLNEAGEVQPPEKPHVDLSSVLSSVGLSPVLGALLYQYGLRPMRKRREQKKQGKPNGA